MYSPRRIQWYYFHRLNMTSSMLVSSVSSMERGPVVNKDCGKPRGQEIVKKLQSSGRIYFWSVVKSLPSASFLLSPSHLFSLSAYIQTQLFTMSAYVQAPKRKLDSVDAPATSTSRKQIKLSAPQPKPSVWGGSGNAAAALEPTNSFLKLQPCMLYLERRILRQKLLSLEARVFDMSGMQPLLSKLLTMANVNLRRMRRPKRQVWHKNCLLMLVGSTI